MAKKPPLTPYQQVDMALVTVIAELCKRLLETRALDANSMQTTLLVLRDQARSTRNYSSAATFDLLLKVIFDSDAPPPSADVVKFPG